MLKKPLTEIIAEMMDEAEHDVPTHMNFPAEHRRKLRSINLLWRLNAGIKR